MAQSSESVQPICKLPKPHFQLYFALLYTESLRSGEVKYKSHLFYHFSIATLSQELFMKKCPTPEESEFHHLNLMTSCKLHFLTILQWSCVLVSILNWCILIEFCYTSDVTVNIKEAIVYVLSMTIRSVDLVLLIWCWPLIWLTWLYLTLILATWF